MGRRPQLEYMLDEHGKPVPVAPEDRDTFVEWMTTTDRTVAYDEVWGAQVHTVFAGIDHGGYLVGGPPVLWETAVGRNGDITIEGRYSSQADALDGHARIVRRLLGAPRSARSGEQS